MSFVITTTYLILIGLAVFLSILLLLKRDTGNDEIEINSAILGPSEIEKHAVEVARTHVVKRNTALPNWLVPQVKKDYTYILDTYKSLNIDIEEGFPVPPAVEWLLDNFYIIEEQAKDIHQSISRQYHHRLPVLERSYLKGYPRIYAIALELVTHTDGSIDEKTVINFIKSYQTQVLLSVAELWALPVMLRIALIWNLRYICKNLMESQHQRRAADELADIISKNIEQGPNELVEIVKEHVKTMGTISSTFAAHLIQKIRNHGSKASGVLSYLDEKLAEQNSSAEAIASLEHQVQAARQVSIGNSIISLKSISTMDWTDMFESLSQVEHILRQDPGEVYSRMDFESRDYYRHMVEKMARIFNTSETFIALKSIECASEARGSENSNAPEKHVGYYLIGKGRRMLEKKMGASYRGFYTLKNAVSRRPTAFYIGSIVILTLCILLPYIYYTIGNSRMYGTLMATIAGILVLIPASDIAVTIVNFVVTRIYNPSILPKLELKDGIPAELSTMVIVPTLLPNKRRVQELLEQLEINYLANKEDHVYFALVGDFKDSVMEEVPEDRDILDAALKGIADLNERYSTGSRDKFYYFHRRRQFNPSQNKWMGWERKRGAIIEYNDLILSSKETSYSNVSCDLNQLPWIKYVITLDADTRLPIGNAKKLIGTLSHPLNQAVIDKEKRIVKEGYGLLQPRIDVSITSANSTLFSRIFAGQGGIDPYTTAVSDVYQDLFGEGIFTGKGIYDLNVFQEILKDSIPDNTVLSHDLLEGSYIRAGLVTDITMVDGYPARYNSYAMRLHRWVRGDWQLIPWLAATVRDRYGHRRKNPLSAISRWKILDNLRRSLLNPSLALLIILGVALLPGNSLVWLMLAIVSAAMPAIMYTLGKLFSYNHGASRIRRNLTVLNGFRASVYQSLILISFIAYQAYLMSGAIIKTLGRLFFTRKNMLEWVTAADMEASLKNNRASFWNKMWISPVLGAVVFTFAILFSPEAIVVAGILMLFWSIAPYTAYMISLKHEKITEALGEEGRLKLRRIARKTWRYFEDTITKKDNYLPPDNFQEDPPNGVAHRTSPTNIGLMLASALSAKDLGYIGCIELEGILDNTITVVEKLDKWQGHLYNWYNTLNLQVMRPRYVSTVDSGNFVGYLMVVEEGLKSYLDKKVIDANMVLGIKDTVNLFNEEHKEFGITIDTAQLDKLAASGDIDARSWNKLLDSILSVLSDNDIDYYKIKKSAWGSKLIKMLHSFKKDITELMPMAGYEPESAGGNRLRADNPIRRCFFNASLLDMADTYRQAEEWIESYITADQKKENREDDLPEAFVGENLAVIKSRISAARQNAEQVIGQYKDLIKRVNALAAATKFAPLFDPKRQLFSIGYSVDENRLTKSYYDLYASEARQASYIAIARGEVDKKHWFRLGRRLTSIDGYVGLVSWTGTMFEYLMPSLIMKSYDNTLLDETYNFVVKAQKNYGKNRGIPWGTSESAYYAFDINLNYQYRAFGVPELGLKRGLVNDMVVAPYATILALSLDPEGVMKNINKLIAEGMEGMYGLYEAIDFTPSRLHSGQKSNIVKNFMVHHQGMSMLALNNYLNNNIMQDRFHRSPTVKAAELLLQERVPESTILTKEFKEKVVPVRRIPQEDGDLVRKFEIPESELPNMHILSNGNYSIMITDGGSGYSKSNDIAISRWKETLRGSGSGMFIFVQNINSNNAWSTAYEPFNVVPEEYKVTFAPDKAVFVRKDGNIETHTEIIASTEDNAEIRRVTLSNHSEHTRTLEVTSYFEVVLTHADADLAHPTFSNLFVITEFDPQYECLLASRRARSENQKALWLMHTVCVEGDITGNLQYETDRSKFIGRNRDVSNPIAMEIDQPLTNTAGPVLDPVMSLRRRVIIKPGESVKVSYITAVGESRNGVLELAEKYKDIRSIERAFELAWNRSQIESRYLGFKASEVQVYLGMLPSIILAGPLRRKWSDKIMKNKLGQPSLWKFGISGDIPIILAAISDKDQIDLVVRLLKAHEYWRLKGLTVDIAFMMEDETSYVQPLHDAIRDAVSSSHAREMIGARGGVFILNAALMDQEDITLLYTAARIVLKGEEGSIEEQLALSTKENVLPGIVAGASTSANAEVVRSDMQNNIYDTSKLLFYNGLGGFTQDGREYIIFLNDNLHTPAPWTNVISNARFGFNVTESGGGYTWSENSRENKLTVWSNDPVSDMPGEIFYIRDESSGEFWNITPMPVRERGNYIIRHGRGYTAFEKASHGIEQQLTEFAAENEPVKICIISFRNITRIPRELSATYYIRPVLGVNEKVTAQYITTQVHEGTGVLLITNKFNPDFPDRVAFMDTSEVHRSYTGDRTEFIGVSGSIGEPDAMKREKLSGMVGAGLDPCAAMQVKVRLNPGERREIVFLLGQGGSTEEALLVANKFRRLNEAKGELEKIKGYWDKKLGVIQVDTPDTSMNVMLNGWLQYQVVSCRLWARSAFYQSGGAYGYRDQLQDVMAVVYTWPELTRKQILLHCAHQFVEGDVQHWWHPGADKGIRTRYSDDFLWLPYVTADYIHNTDDWTVLDEVVNYLEDEPLAENEDERYNIPRISKEKSDVYEHCIRAIENGLKFGAHGIPLMGSGDWNDGMNTVGNKGRGESIWLGWFLYTILVNFIPICLERKDDERAERYKTIAEEIAEAIEANAWDGSWYRRAYFDDGTPLGSAQNTECRIDAIAQSWSSISGAGKPHRIKEAMHAVQNYLVDREVGIIKLLTPPFNEGDLNPGYIKGYVPGVRENGGQYTHAAVWTVLAFAKLGEGNTVWDLYHLINPINHSRTPIECARYKVEPYVMAADVYAVYPNVGRGGWTWYTGAAGWMYRVGLEHILGIKKKGQKLIFDPCIPANWHDYKIRYSHGSSLYTITVKNPEAVNKGVKTVTSDGKLLDDLMLPLVDDGKEHKVEVVMG